MGLVPASTIMKSHADVDNAPTAACLQVFEGCLAHGKCPQGINVEHCRVKCADWTSTDARCAFAPIIGQYATGQSSIYTDKDYVLIAAAAT